MNTTPEQFRIAADILEKGLQWQENWNGVFIDADGEGELWECLRSEREIRIKPASFPPIPEGMTYHNPDGLTAEQVGDGYRITVVEEIDGRHEGVAMRWSILTEKWEKHCAADSRICTYRIPISTPFPDGSRIVDGKLVKPWTPKFKVGDRVQIALYAGALEIGHVTRIEAPTNIQPRPYVVEYEKGGGAGGWVFENQLELAPLPEPPKLVPLGPSDWLKDGPWWVRSSEEDKCPSMVVAVNVHNISYGRYGNSAHEEAVNLQRSNDGINWLPCSKTA